MNFATPLRLPPDTFRSQRSHLSIPLHAHACREWQLPFARPSELLRSQNGAAKIAGRSAALRVDPLASTRWFENVCRRLSQLGLRQSLNLIQTSFLELRLCQAIRCATLAAAETTSS